MSITTRSISALRCTPFLALALLAQGCDSPQNYLHGAGPAAKGLASFGWFVLIVFSVVTIVVWLLMIWLVSRRRGSLAEHAPIDANGGQSWIVIGGFAIPTVTLAIIFISTLETLQAFPMDHPGNTTAAKLEEIGVNFFCALFPTGAPPDIVITGRQWWFDAQYQFARTDLDVKSPTEIHIPVGKPVEIALQTRDVIHSFWIPKLHGKVDLVPGQVNRIRIRADRPGVFEGECAEYCGLQHAHMRLRVIAQAPDDFQRWLAAQREPAMQVTSQHAVHGAEVFQGSACPLCHTIRGTSSQGSVGPELTHVGSRGRIAGGAYENNAQMLATWVSHAQSLKPGSQMPDLAQLSGPDLTDLVIYLQSLK